ncbi:hypothetical protein Adt_18199 [Abeliophyllum distichum]|uniref:PilZ domain-containing protein n=1 Tax=Abeliophyllum distichum TaxID=126358 RepID=A0ABD1TIP4_9LAMI
MITLSVYIICRKINGDIQVKRPRIEGEDFMIRKPRIEVEDILIKEPCIEGKRIQIKKSRLSYGGISIRRPRIEGEDFLIRKPYTVSKWVKSDSFVSFAKTSQIKSLALSFLSFVKLTG